MSNEIIYDKISGVGRITAFSGGSLTLGIGPLTLSLGQEVAKKLAGTLKKVSDPSVIDFERSVKNVAGRELMRFEKRECGLFFYLGAAIGFMNEKQSARASDKLNAAITAIRNIKKVAA